MSTYNLLLTATSAVDGVESNFFVNKIRVYFSVTNCQDGYFKTAGVSVNVKNVT